MLRWIVYIKLLNPKICHISRKNTAMADMLSRARFEGESDMVWEDENVAFNFFKKVQLSAEDRGMLALHTFNDGEWLLIGKFLSTLKVDTSWTKEEAQRIR